MSEKRQVRIRKVLRKNDMLIRMITLGMLMIISGCRVIPNTSKIPQGNFTFHFIKKMVAEQSPHKDFMISFSSDVDYRQDKRIRLTCLLKSNGIVSQNDFDSIIVMPNSPSITFDFYDAKTQRISSNQFLYTLSGNYYSSFKFNDKGLATDRYTDGTIKDKIPDIGLTCAFFDTYPTPFAKRYISNPMVIPKEEFLKVLQ